MVTIVTSSTVTSSARPHYRLALVVVMSFFIMAVLSLGFRARARSHCIRQRFAYGLHADVFGTSSQSCTLRPDDRGERCGCGRGLGKHREHDQQRSRQCAGVVFLSLTGPCANAGSECVATLVCHNAQRKRR